MRQFGFHTFETFTTGIVGAISAGLLIGCSLHAWDNRKRHQPATAKTEDASDDE